MSKIAKKPIVLPEGVDAVLKDGLIELKGKNGAISLKALPHIKVEIKDKQITLTTEESHPQARANWGTLASLIKNAIAGLQGGFTKTLELEGIGFRASMEGATLVLLVGYSHPVKYTPPAGINIKLEKNKIIISGIDKAVVGQAAAQIRKVKEPEPYKGTGIHYAGEVIRRKAGKKAAGTTGAAA